jgi:hypothetical protein
MLLDNRFVYAQATNGAQLIIPVWVVLAGIVAGVTVAAISAPARPPPRRLRQR